MTRVTSLSASLTARALAAGTRSALLAVALCGLLANACAGTSDSNDSNPQGGSSALLGGAGAPLAAAGSPSITLPGSGGAEGGAYGVAGSAGAEQGGAPAGAAGDEAGAQAGAGAVIVSDGLVPFKPAYILGADISWTLEDEAGGAKYSNGSKVEPLEQIMAENGFNYIRLRTFVNPAAAGGYSRQGFCDTAHTITMAKRVKACGMGLFLDFHMSDTWASIGVWQNAPAAWKGMTPTQMQAAAHDYVKGVLTQMVAAGVEPDMVQIGNESNGGMSGVPISNWADFSGLVNSAIKAVREVDPKIIVWAQNGRPRPPDFEPWVDKYLSGMAPNVPKIDEDGICGSTYGTTNNGQDWADQFGWVVSKYNKPVMSCEYTDKAPDSPAGGLINGVMRKIPNGMGRGSFIWEPTRYPAVNSSTLFTKSGNTYTANSAMAEYPTLAKSYGLPVPSGVCK